MIQLVNTDGVVFINNGNDLLLQQGLNRIQDVGAIKRIFQIVARQQKLRDSRLIVQEALRIDAHQFDLA